MIASSVNLDSNVRVGDRSDRPRRRAPHEWLRAHPRWAAGILLLIAFVHPAEGTGVPICWMSAWTGIPCPGCGMTRSLSCCAHGDLAGAWSYHAFGTVLFIAAVIVAATSVTPRSWRDRVARRLAPHRGLCRLLGVIVAVAFFGDGAVRALAHAAT